MRDVHRIAVQKCGSEGLKSLGSTANLTYHRSACCKIQIEIKSTTSARDRDACRWAVLIRVVAKATHACLRIT
jgi:hypothetical protein